MAPPAPVVGVTRQHDGSAPGGTAEWARCLRLELRNRGHVAFAVLSLAVLGIGTPPADAQNDPVPWAGTVEVMGGPLSVKAGESVTYFLRLSEPPTADGWWVMVHVDGVVWGDVGYKGLSWVPSVGWGFDQDDWNVWRGITIRADENAALSTQVTFTHEVWDHTAECPVHNVGSVTVQVTETTDPPLPPPPPDLPELEIDDVEVNEDGGNAVFSVILRGQSTETVTVTYATSDGTAEAGPDYTAANGMLTFGVGETAKAISVEVVDDGDAEGDETFTVSLSSPQNASLEDDTGTATIRANDGGVNPPPPDLPELEIDDVEVSEDAGTAVFSVTLSEQSDATVTVTFGTSNGSAIAGLDYTATNGTLVFQPGQQAKTIAVVVSDDTRQEGDETFTVSLSNPQNATLLEGVGTATIEDNDGTQPPPGLTLAINDVTVSEGGGSAVFNVRLSGQSNVAVTVAYGTSNGTASAGSDYTGTNGTLVFQPGQQAKTIAVAVSDDTRQEGDETFTVSLSNPQNATLLKGVGTATIEDNDGTQPPPGLTLAINDVTVSEGGGSAVFNVRLSEQSNVTVTVAYGTSNGTASAGSDYTGTNGTLVFQPGQRAKTIAVAVSEDTRQEGDETFTVSLSNPQNATLLKGVGTATIEDNDGTQPPPGLTLAIDDVTVSEGGGSAVFNVRLSGQSNVAVTVAYGTSNGTASAGSDYTGTNGTLVFQPGQRAKTIAVAVSEDTRQEGDETFTVSLSNPQNATLLKGVGTATIEDNDGTQPPPGLTLAIDDVTVSEGGGSAVFNVRLSEQSNVAVTVAYGTSNGTASAGSDYTGTNGTLVFQPGQQAKTIAVAVSDDTLQEGNETFTVGLSNPQNATLLKGVGTATIVDNDGTQPPPGLPTLSIFDVAVTEGSGSAVFRVGLNKQSGDVVTVEYATSDGTAAAGLDYTSTSATLTFEPGDTRKTVAVPVLDDRAVEGNETFTVRLSGPQNATLRDSEATGTIRDDDGDETLPPSGLPALAIYDVAVSENAGSAVFRVGLSGESDQAVTVAYRTSDWTATAGADYTATDGTLVFQPGETRKAIAVPVLDDSEEEGDRDVHDVVERRTQRDAGRPGGDGDDPGR